MRGKNTLDTPSGFFEDWEAGRAEESPALELLHTSGSGMTQLYRSRSGGRNLLYESILRKEFEIGFSLTHPGICAYYSFTPLEGLGNAIELEWVEGCTLREWLKQHPARARRKAVLDELLDALSYMHRKQVIHRDLKPENIMVTDQGDHVRIIDFGFSDSDAHAVNKGAAGTRAYAAPELLAGKGADERSDIWSVGAILEELDPGLRPVARRCLSPDPSKRYPDIPALQKALARRRRLWILPLLILLLAASGLAVCFRTYGDAALDGLVREAEEAISATISLSE